MRFKLSTLFLASALLASLAMAVSPALAQTKTLNVPFSFTVNGKSLPPGSYTVERDGNTNVLKLIGKDPSNVFAWVASPSADGSAGVVLRFQKKNGARSLYNVQYGTLVTPRLNSKTPNTTHDVEEVAPSM